MLNRCKNCGLPYIPCRTYNSDKFGGWVAENYRAMTMLSPWLFRCLLDDQMAPRVTVLPPTNKPRGKWTLKENTAWLKVRGIKVPPKTSATERRKIVEGHFTDPLGPPAVLPDTTPSAREMWHLLLLLFHIFGTLFSTFRPCFLEVPTGTIVSVRRNQMCHNTNSMPL